MFFRLIHVDIQKKQIQYYKAIILQLKIFLKIRVPLVRTSYLMTGQMEIWILKHFKNGPNSLLKIVFVKL